MSQNGKLLAYLQQHGSVTQLEAFNGMGICRLSERVRELESLGFVIEHRSVTVPARDGKTARVTRYRLIAEPNPSYQTERQSALRNAS